MGGLKRIAHGTQSQQRQGLRYSYPPNQCMFWWVKVLKGVLVSVRCLDECKRMDAPTRETPEEDMRDYTD